VDQGKNEDLFLIKKLASEVKVDSRIMIEFRLIEKNLAG
jgi:hypothetical protein